jgi:dTDP-4-dehydrorhamnose 3,5-epimerase
MEVIKTEIEGVVIIEPRLFKDERGYFFESFSQRDFDKQVRTIHFVQDNESKSSYGVLRGLHFQKPPFAQSKLVRVIKGAVLENNLVTQYAESVSESARNEELAVVVFCQFYGYVLSESRRAFPYIYCHIQYGSFNDPYQLAFLTITPLDFKYLATLLARI